MKSNLKEILTPGCQCLRKKLIFFSIFEKWVVNDDLQINHLVAHTQNMLLKEYDNDLYYHSLFHLFTCLSCFDEGHELLEDKVHPDLLEMTQQPPGMHINTLIKQKKLRTKNLQAYYFCLFWEKVHLYKTNNPVITFHTHRQLQTQVIATAAAGIADMFPDRIPIPVMEEVYLCFENDATSDLLNVMIIGGTPATREKINIELFFLCGDKQMLRGKEIAIGGMWSIPSDKAQNICLIDFYYQENL